MMIKANAVGLKRGDSAMLLSPVYKNPKGVEHCAQFWYHMNGNDMGILNIQTKVDGKDFQGGFSASSN